ncbi:uncharacterized protein LOC119909496 [Micropterus salmoides]|uniref:uncharacterized protein LOC119909496 n=1 Tax=Micropterus salmoides TaxID=27706 RepID=UPI0018EDAEA7|nr:uncharacterized protein LOC119909496 [Micropterus salmoides]
MAPASSANFELQNSSSETNGNLAQISDLTISNHFTLDLDIPTPIVAPATFDTINHSILLTQLQYSLGLTCTALSWLNSYLSDNQQYIYRNSCKSSTIYTLLLWAGKLPLSFTVRVGDEVTLPCENVIDGQQRCEYTTWIFSGSGNKPAVKLFELGQIHNEAKSKSDRLSVTENCSLVIKKVTVEDVGYYGCRQFNKSGQQAPDSLVHLSVIIMTEHQDGDKVTLNCSVLTHKQFCRHTVKWLYEGKDVDKDNKDMKTSQSVCYTTVSFPDSHFINKSKSNLTCEVTDRNSRKVQLFTFSPQSSGEKTG